MFRVATENHKTGPFNAPTETYKNEPYTKSALSGSIWMLTFVTLISVPIGVLSAIYLEEYSKKNRKISLSIRI